MFTYPPQLSDAVCETYKRANDVDLNIWWFEAAATDSSPRPAILFFFGGGWRTGSPERFAPQARYLAKRGMVAMVADYRVGERNGVLASQCLEDAKAGFRWVQANTERLNIDPTRIAVGGGSAGGHLAAATALVPDSGKNPDGDTERNAPSQLPNALVLFNPALVLGPTEGFTMDGGRLAALTERMGIEPKLISPYHHLAADAPPTIIFHGRADSTIPFASAEMFAAKMQELGNQCELVGYDGEEHGFFNHGRGDGSAYEDTVRRMDEFLTSLGWLDAAL